MNASAIGAAVSSVRFRWTCEKDLQDGIELALGAAGIDFDREHDLGKAGRVDFMVGRSALEVKTQGSRWAVLRQLLRYAEHPDVDEVVLVTTSMKLDVPKRLAGKPARVVRIPRL